MLIIKKNLFDVIGDFYFNKSSKGNIMYKKQLLNDGTSKNLKPLLD